MNFLINSTIGILGLFDVATDMGLDKNREDFGQTHDIGDQQDDEDGEDDIMTDLMKQVKKNLQLPTLDQLLDKVVEHGVESLTPYEKATLDNYSQK
mgnify:CR=1 FL=1